MLVRYTKDHIIPVKWGKLFHDESGLWRRDWSIEFVPGHKRSFPLRKFEEICSNDVATVRAAWQRNDTMLVSIISDKWGWDDEVFIFNYRLLRTVELVYGPMSMLEGQARSDWRSFNTVYPLCDV